MNTPLQQDNFKKLEGMLYSVPMLKAEMENLKLSLEELDEIETFRSSSNEIKPSTPTYAVNSSVESEVIKRDKLHQSEHYLSLQRNIRAIERKLKKIDNMLAVLDDKEHLIITKRYFEHKTIEQIVDLLGYTDRQSFYRFRKSIIVKKLLPLYVKSF